MEESWMPRAAVMAVVTHSLPTTSYPLEEFARQLRGATDNKVLDAPAVSM
jgi:hypothetical protein